VEKGSALDPNDALIQASLSAELRSVGRLTDAIKAGQRAVELDPYSPWGVITYIFTLRVAGQVREMEDEIGKARNMWGETQTADFCEFIYALQYGDPRRAEALLPSLDLDEFDAEAARRTIAARLNPTPANVDAALNLYREQMQRSPSQGGGYLLRLGIFGRTEEAFALLADKSFQKGFVGWEILFTPPLAHVRNDPRFIRVAADLGLLNYWRQSGHWPDFCSDPRLPYDCKTEAAKYK
jgi:tetratricopeptide (TPR) repeat protein